MKFSKVENRSFESADEGAAANIFSSEKISSQSSHPQAKSSAVDPQQTRAFKLNPKQKRERKKRKAVLSKLAPKTTTTAQGAQTRISRSFRKPKSSKEDA